MSTLMVVLSLMLIAGTTVPGKVDAKMAQAQLKNAQGEIVGLVTLSEDANQAVQVVTHVHNLPPGMHAFHIHETGACTPPDFESAGGHFNPHGKEHGLMDVDGPHAGDLPNLVVAPDGTAVQVVLAPRVTFDSGQSSLFRTGGTAFVIHEGADDYRTDPSGDAGARLACGVITRIE